MEKVVHKVVQFIEENALFTKSDKLLLAVSGGVDSMVMIDILQRSGYDLAIAHCNFQLRGDESQADEKFVEFSAKELNLPFFSTRFETSEYAKLNGVSIQMAARKLRYEWFGKLLKEFDYYYVLTAHHANDLAETLLFNLTQGTGLSGLTGIKAKQELKVRPLLLLTKEEIVQYANANEIAFREDASNLENKYKRNAIRNQVVPVLEQINPQAIQHLNDTASYLKDIENLIEPVITAAKEECIDVNDLGTSINITALKRYEPMRTYLFYFLKPYGFNSSQVASICEGLEGDSGQQYFSDEYELVKDRNELLIRSTNESVIKPLMIDSLNDFDQSNFQVELVENNEALKIEQAESWACLYYDKLSFPLELRSWQQGDRFQPFGMKGQKKVSDFLIDHKVNLHDKQKVQVLVSGDDICWLVGHRINHNYSISSSTQKVLKINYTA